MAAGAVMGAAASIAFMELVGKSRLDTGDPGVVVAMIAGLSYGAMGLFVGLGILAPRQGAMFLNVEDAEEIREQRATLWPSAVACMLIGMFMLVLALAPEGEGSGRTGWALGAGACLAGAWAVALATRGRTDELLRQVSLEASALTLHIALLGLSLWGLLSHLGFVAWMSPLTLVAGLALLYLAAIFWSAGRKGLMADR
jgi:hypothetical protein